MARKTSQPPPGAPANRRGPGRPVGDSADLRERLLDAALTCYSRQGIAATPLRAIAVEAGVNPALLHYYFGDKGQLQQAVIDERLMPAIENVGVALASAGDDPAGLIASLVRGIGDAVARHPWLPSLWVREVLCEGGALRDLMVDRIGPQIPQRLAQRFASAQRAGALNPGLDPRLLVVSLVGLTLFPAASAPLWGRVFDTHGIDADVLRDHTLVLLERGLGAG